MSRPLTIVMYHYVRDLARSRYPEIKGLTVEQFRGQVDYMERFYSFVTVDNLIASLETENGVLPKNAAILTFDDGYADHYLNVFPILEERGIQGCFFPPGKAVIEHQVLDVNKLHYVLASVPDKQAIVSDIFSMLDEWRSEHNLKSNQHYYETYANPGRYDPPEVVFIKRIRMALPERCQEALFARLFQKYVTEDETAFAAELYMNTDQLKCMKRNGMYIGSHGYDHVWLETLGSAAQESEIDLSLQFLGGLGVDLNHWTFAYPFDSRDESLVSILKARGCKLALTGNVGIADLDAEDRLMLSRLDTNDLPKNKDAEPNEWTMRVMA